MNDTRDRILQVSLDLFIEPGYEAVSLREIAERVGVTKAALYYHFASKEDILRTLVQPFLGLEERFGDMLARRPTLESWAEELAAFIKWILPQRRIFELVENNHSALHSLARGAADGEMHRAEDGDMHSAMHDRIGAMLSDDSLPLSHRVRIAGSLGVVVGVLAIPASNAFARVPTEELEPLLNDLVRRVLQVD
jgi:AcrR family transcriptional regulator